MQKITRRRFLGIGTKVGTASLVTGLFAPAPDRFFGLGGVARADGKKVTPFSFALITDSHIWDIPHHKFTVFLERCVQDVNNIKPAPDFVIYTGDVAQHGKQEELEIGKSILDRLGMPYKIIPGEHDYYLDMGEAWRGMFGQEHWSFDHKGVHFIGMNSILLPPFWKDTYITPLKRMTMVEELECHKCGHWGVGEAQLTWLEQDVKKVPPDTPVVIFTHSPLWDYYPRWNFQTVDAPQIRGLLDKFDKVIAIHGHVHQVVYNEIGNIISCGTLSTSWPWPYPPTDIPYPHIKMNRLNPGHFEDGEGTHLIDLRDDFSGRFQWRPMLAETLPANLQSGIIV